MKSSAQRAKSIALHAAVVLQMASQRLLRNSFGMIETRMNPKSGNIAERRADVHVVCSSVVGQFEGGTGVPPVKSRARCTCHTQTDPLLALLPSYSGRRAGDEGLETEEKPHAAGSTRPYANPLPMREGDC